MSATESMHLDGASVAKAIDAAVATPATTTTNGTVKQVAHIANLVAAPTEADFNGLLAALQAAGVMA